MSLRFVAVVLLAVSAAVAVAGCETKCFVDCAEAGAIVDTRALPAPVVSATADAPCTVNQELLEDGGTGQEVYVAVNGNSPGSCQIHATLADGSSWVAVLSWAVGSSDQCCPNVTYNVGPAPMFTRVNDGAG